MDNSVQIHSGVQHKSNIDMLIRLFDEAVLQITAETVHSHLRSSSPGSILVAHDSGQNRIIGACLIAPVDNYDYLLSNSVSCPLPAQRCPTELTHIAVTHSRQANGIGSRLVMTAATEAPGPLVVQFHRSVRPFYAKLGFDIAPVSADMSETDINGASDDTEAMIDVSASASASLSTHIIDSTVSNIPIYCRGTLR